MKRIKFFGDANLARLQERVDGWLDEKKLDPDKIDFIDAEGGYIVVIFYDSRKLGAIENEAWI